MVEVTAGGKRWPQNLESQQAKAKTVIDLVNTKGRMPRHKLNQTTESQNGSEIEDHSVPLKIDVQHN